MTDLTATCSSRPAPGPPRTPTTQTRAELEALVAAAERGEETDLADRFDGTLEFGTAGLRGALGAGPNRMNRVVVTRAAAGLAAYLSDTGHAGGSVVIGYDARHNSDVFARDTAEVMTGAGFKALVHAAHAAHPAARLRDPRARLRGRRDGHRQPQPAAGQRLQGLPRRRQPDRAARRRRDRRADRRRRPAGRPAPRRRRQASSARTSSTATSTPWPTSPRTARATSSIVYTPLHGVGGTTVAQVLETAGFDAPARRASSRSTPTPTSRPSPSPTPRSRARWTSRWRSRPSTRADLVVANDPDADRCAVAVPGRARLADAARRRGRRAARPPPASPRRAPASTPTRSCPRACWARWPRPPASRTRRR